MIIVKNNMYVIVIYGLDIINCKSDLGRSIIDSRRGYYIIKGGVLF